MECRALLFLVVSAGCASAEEFQASRNELSCGEKISNTVQPGYAVTYSFEVPWQDMWWQGIYTFSTCGSTFDTTVELFWDPSLSLVSRVGQCADCPPSCGAQAALRMSLAPGTYYLRARGVNQRQGGELHLEAACSGTQQTDAPTAMPTPRVTLEPAPLPSDGCMCTTIFDPVCGTNNMTYGNACHAGCEQQEVACEGVCPCTPPVACLFTDGCSGGQTTCNSGTAPCLQCPPILCTFSQCPAHPDATCYVSSCGACKPAWINEACEVVDCDERPTAFPTEVPPAVIPIPAPHVVPSPGQVPTPVAIPAPAALAPVPHAPVPTRVPATPFPSTAIPIYCDTEVSGVYSGAPVVYEFTSQYNTTIQPSTCGYTFSWDTYIEVRANGVTLEFSDNLGGLVCPGTPQASAVTVHVEAGVTYEITLQHGELYTPGAAQQPYSMNLHCSERIDAYWETMFANTSYDYSRLSCFNGIWFYDSVSTCVGKGQYWDICPFHQLHCAGNITYGWGVQQRDAVLNALATPNGKYPGHDECPIDIPCTSIQYTCINGACVELEKLCDGTDDCQDGFASDEDNGINRGMCERPASPAATPAPGADNLVVQGCPDQSAVNYNPEANFDDGSCEYSGFPSPTSAPVSIPTNAAIPSPTHVPVPATTNTPTDAPTGVPSDAPVPAPTDMPTNAPTDAPSSDCQCRRELDHLQSQIDALRARLARVEARPS